MSAAELEAEMRWTDSVAGFWRLFEGSGKTSGTNSCELKEEKKRTREETQARLIEAGKCTPHVQSVARRE